MKKENKNNKAKYFIISFLIFLLVLSIIGFIMLSKTSTTTTQDYIDSDKCKPPAGYNEEDWREHMSHHPNIYKECLNN